jgi:hypothetical protein
MPQLRQFDNFYHHKIHNSLQERLMMGYFGKKYGGKSGTQVFLLLGVICLSRATGLSN